MMTPARNELRNSDDASVRCTRASQRANRLARTQLAAVITGQGESREVKRSERTRTPAVGNARRHRTCSTVHQLWRTMTQKWQSAVCRQRDPPHVLFDDVSIQLPWPAIGELRRLHALQRMHSGRRRHRSLVLLAMAFDCTHRSTMAMAIIVGHASQILTWQRRTELATAAGRRRNACDALVRPAHEQRLLGWAPAHCCCCSPGVGRAA